MVELFGNTREKALLHLYGTLRYVWTSECSRMFQLNVNEPDAPSLISN